MVVTTGTARSARLRASAPRTWLDPCGRTFRHCGGCEQRDTAYPAILRAILRVHDREGYWWVQCGACDCGWQVQYYAAESIG